MTKATSGKATPKGFARWLRLLRAGRQGAAGSTKATDPLRAAGQMLREAREEKGMGLRDLAQRTRISIAVLEAMEGGWKDRLPEATYLRAMLPLLEHQLDLPTGSLEPVLPHAAHRGPGMAHLAAQQSFTPTALQRLAPWQSSLLYGGLVLALVYGLNLQQQRLASMGRLAMAPIPLNTMESSPTESPVEEFPDLHPLKRAAKGQAMAVLTREGQTHGLDLSLGLLSLRLKAPTQLELRSRHSGTTALMGLQGDLSLPVIPPFELRLNPAPAAGAVRWNGKVLPGKPPPGSSGSAGDPAAALRREDTTRPGIYSFPLGASQTPVAPGGPAPASR